MESGRGSVPLPYGQYRAKPVKAQWVFVPVYQVVFSRSPAKRWRLQAAICHAGRPADGAQIAAMAESTPS